ncbi:MAG: hypothetical protein LBI68_09135, partial [Azoarcus sp.]|nr:hypothetical protein [Azoarcus sp.]
GQKAETYLAGIDKSELTASDIVAWNEAAVRVGASRWAAQLQVPPQSPKGRPIIRLTKGNPGQTCIQIVPANEKEKENEKTQSDVPSHCTYGQVWPASLSISPDGKMMTLAVQPLDSWREMWVFRQDKKEWQLTIMPPAFDTPELGYIEFAGWVPGNQQMLVAREVSVKGQTKTSFELWNRDTLAVERRADKPGNLSAFYRWQDPNWKNMTVTVR